ncbi:MAG: HAD family hydrolase [Thermanaerothrix sp.]|nr:HAD family hydrolase [Thermanaerothrix sp.]
MIRGVVFDLDDTLYFEEDYVRSGFSHVASAVAAACGLDPCEVFGFLWRGFLQGVRGSSFDALLECFPLAAERFTPLDLVRIYREHRPRIGLGDETLELLSYLRDLGLWLGVISDGPLESQRRKASALGLDQLFHRVILTDRYGRDFWKPSEGAFRMVEEESGLRGALLCYVGDNPQKDFTAPNRLGWLTVRFRHPRQLRFREEPDDPSKAPAEEIGDLKDLRRFLA